MSRVKLDTIHAHSHPTLAGSVIFEWHRRGSKAKAREYSAMGYATVLVLAKGERCPACAIEAERLETWDRVLP